MNQVKGACSTFSCQCFLTVYQENQISLGQRQESAESPLGGRSLLCCQGFSSFWHHMKTGKNSAMVLRARADLRRPPSCESPHSLGLISSSVASSGNTQSTPHLDNLMNHPVLEMALPKEFKKGSKLPNKWS